MKILILNSARGKYPIGSESWIQATVQAVSAVAGGSVTVICSTDPSPWSLVTYLAGRNGIRVELIVKTPKGCAGEVEFHHLLEEYNLDSARTMPLFLDKTAEEKILTKALWRVRDRLAVETAQIIYPVSIRPEGRLANLINHENAKSKIRDDFRIPWTKGGYVPHYELDGRNINRLPEGNWFVHWTRASQGQWDGEKAWQFYRDLLNNPGRYVRSAEETVIRILAENRIRGSSWKLPDGEQAVSFTALSLEKTIPLMRWRKRFVRYTFEPYGIAVNRSFLIDCGAQAVRYERKTAGDSNIDRLFYHAPGEKTDWTREKEWRLRGDLLLDGIDDHELLVLVPDDCAKKTLEERMKRDIRIHTIFSD